jgi:CBS-domain-containing membrane protein
MKIKLDDGGTRMLARDVMSGAAVTIPVNMTLRRAAAMLLEHGFNALPVINERQEVVGAVGIRDLLTAPYRAAEGAMISGEIDPAEKLDVWERLRVRDVMATAVISVEEETPLMQVAALMANTGAHPLLVLRDKHVIGTISRREVVKAILNETGQLYRPVMS